MAKVIYSMFVTPEDLPDKERFSLYCFREYYSRLLESKKEYAKKCGADWKFFDDLKKIQEFQEKFSIDTIYNAINLYKIFQFEQLSKKYDEVLYLDFDVIVNTDLNFFEEVDLSEKIWAVSQKDLVDEKIYKWHKDIRNPFLKWQHATALLRGKDNAVINTAIMGGSRGVIKQLGFMKKLQKYIDTTEQLKAGSGYAKKVGGDYESYTHNNEVFFSAALVESGVEHQEDDREWHTVAEPQTTGKLIHYINKNFASHYGDKKNVVYSLHIEIPPELQVDAGAFYGDDIDKNERARLNFLKYEKQLEENKKEYARSIGADYFTFRDSLDYEAFRNEMRSYIPDMSEYNVVNFYKIHCMYELVKNDYDNALYLDFDVVCNTQDSFFDAFNLQVATACAFDQYLQDEAHADVDKLRASRSDEHVYHYRSPYAKYWNAHAMLMEDGYEPRNNVFNTGIWGGSRVQLLELGYFDDFKELLDGMTQLQEDEFSMYIPQIQKSFGYDNETVMSYRVHSRDLRVFNLSTKTWHHKVNENYHTPEQVNREAKLIHVMNKKFEWFF